MQVARKRNFLQSSSSKGCLVHRWSFDNNLTDSISKKDGRIMLLPGYVSYISDSNGTALRCQGSSSTQVQVLLGEFDNVFDYTDEGFTIEAWYNNYTKVNYGRNIVISDGLNDGLNKSIVVAMLDVSGYDYIDRSNSGVTTGDSRCWLQSGNFGTLYHVSVAFRKTGDDTYKFFGAKRNISTGNIVYSSSSNSNYNKVHYDDFPNRYVLLNADTNGENRSGNAAYYEVRLYNRALTDEELTQSCIAGMDNPVIS